MARRRPRTATVAVAPTAHPPGRSNGSDGDPQRTAPTFAETFADLVGFRRSLADQAAARERARVLAQARAAQARIDADLFRHTVGTVSPMLAPARVMPTAPRPLPLPLKTRENEREMMREALSDAYDPDAMIDIDDSLSFRRNGVGVEVVRKLRRGHWVVQSQIDLHGLRTDEARDAMALFIREAAKRGIRCIRVIHGKGLGSVNREPVLKGRVRSWLTQKHEVMAFVEARERDGGAGALIVLLQTQNQC